MRFFTAKTHLLSQRWLNKRIPQKNKTTLSHRHIFILPSRFGVAYLGLCALLFLLATNFQNNLMLLLCYFLLAFFLLSLFACYQNFSGLTIHIHKPHAVFSGEKNLIPLTVISTSTKGQLKLNIGKCPAITINITEQQLSTDIPYQYPTRGEYACPRLRIESYYPLGLFRCWTLLASTHKSVVYPAPKSCELPVKPITAEKSGDEYQLASQENDEFYQLRPYQMGEPYHHIAWKQVAMGRGNLTKQFCGFASQHFELAVDPLLKGNPLEQHLSELAYQIIQLCQHNTFFSLQLANNRVELNSGTQHCSECLRALAKWGHHDSQ